MRKLLALTLSFGFVWGAGAVVLTQAPAAGSSKPVEQKVLAPEARYWMGATTGGGMMAMSAMGKGGIGAMMRMAKGGMPTESRSVELKLGSSLQAKGEPEAFHSMPPAARVSKPVFLQTPEPTTAPRGDEIGPYNRPKGQISFYWGCGEKAGPGQPVVLTFDKLVRGENDPELDALQGSVSARGVRKPSVGNSTTYGDWPHGDRKGRNKGLEIDFPAGSTLAGPHVIEGNYSPKIEFTLAGDKTFMDAVRYTSSGVQPSGAITLSWNSASRATGYSLGVMAPERAGDDSANMIMWSSADRPATFIQMEHLTPAEVNRLIGLKAVLPPSTTTCAIPAEVVKATREGSMLMFTAFGDEATFIHPPRPADPTVTWDQEWFSRVSFNSVRMDMVTPQGIQDMTAMTRDTGQPPSPGAAPQAMTDEEYCKALEENAKDQPAVTDAVPGGRLLRRALGRKKKDEAPAGPRCKPK